MNYNEMHFYKLKYGEGTRGTVYADKNARVAYKEFDRATPPLESTGKILKRIKNLNIHNVYKIYDIISKNKYSLKSLHGYYMEYYEPVGPLLLQPIDYVIKNIYDLKDTLQKLYDNNIETNDLHADNMIVSKEGIIIIDVDNYSFYFPLTKKIFHKPMNVMDLIESIIYNELLDIHGELSPLELHYYMDSNNPDFIENIKQYNNLFEYLIVKNREYQESKKVM